MTQGGTGMNKMQQFIQRLYEQPPYLPEDPLEARVIVHGKVQGAS